MSYRDFPRNSRYNDGTTWFRADHADYLALCRSFEHDTARPVDGYVAPQLHTHAVVFNVTERGSGQPRAIQPQSLFASQQFATAIYQSELTYKLRQLGYEITTGRSGAPEIKGYTQE